ncbi:MAG: endonuclease [Candidatus Symbiothrix sp.]|jgi:predicted extracellular nuclease|nr:endonuclease [Candidatus Symbiothrix sp.]
MKTNPILLFFFLSVCACSISAQQTFRVMFYNVENLFDPSDDPEKQDEDFTPEGVKHWSNYRYYTKLNHLAKVISAVGEWETPALIGLCEVENDQAMKDLTAHSLLKQRKYQYVMTESPDVRGIDVALMYQRDRFKYLSQENIRIVFPKNKRKKTRDVLHVIGKVISGDTLDVFVCHFPSRRGGQTASEPDRIHVASIVRAKADSLISVRQNANILIMGDFNDEPTDRSIAHTLLQTGKKQLVNLFDSMVKSSPTGSYKFQNEWNFLDQIIVSDNLLQPEKQLHVLPNTATIFRAGFLLIEDRTQGGIRPLKTFHGGKYEGGYSDHLPVFVDFVVN